MTPSYRVLFRLGARAAPSGPAFEHCQRLSRRMPEPRWQCTRCSVITYCFWQHHRLTGHAGYRNLKVAPAPRVGGRGRVPSEATDEQQRH